MTTATPTRRRSPLPAELDTTAIVALIDSREQLPLDLSPLRSEVASLRTGDYSARGLTHKAAFERKSLSDLLGCCGGERERFEAEVMRLLAFPYRGLVVEATMADLERGEWRNQLTPAQVIGSVLGWSLMGLPVHLVGSHEAAGKAVARLLAIAARREWRQCRTFAVGVLDEASEGSEAA